MEKDLNCKICGVEHSTQNRLINHIKKHHPEYSYESYVVHFYFNDQNPLCKCGCGTVMQFFSYEPTFFSDYTKNHFPRKLHTEETKKKIAEGGRRTFQRNYGVDNPMELPESIVKIAETKLANHGDPRYNNLEKAKQTFLENYGDEKYRNTAKMVETNLRIYGAKTFTSTPEGIAQIKATKLKNFGDEDYVNIEKGKKTKLDRYGYECEFTDRNWRNEHNLGDSKIQVKTMNDLGGEKVIYNGHEFDIKFHNYLIEIDGVAYHMSNMSNMTITQLNSVQNDFKKTNLVKQFGEYELIRISTTKLKKIKRAITFEDIWELSYEQDFTFDFFTKFVTKEYLKKYIDKRGADNLNKYWKIFLRFVRIFQPKFPTIPTEETISDVISTISKYDVTAIHNGNNFNANCYSIGNSYLKSNFESYWKSSFKGRKSPIEAWEDDKTMERVIKYRIGLNNSSEIFDFSLHQLVRGLSVTRHAVSFFKPLLAASIYTHFLGESVKPVVFDPCCGFGGRLLGFKAKYPTGKYIGCEPNIETFNELLELSKNFTDVELHNCKLEDFDITSIQNVDLSFTSIPYFDLEIYSNPVKYLNFDDWKASFITKLITLPNLVVNIPKSMRDVFKGECVEYFISSNTDHFNKGTGEKYEYLLSFIND